MRVKFPESSREVVERLNKEHEDTEIMAEFVPDDKYNPQTIVAQINPNGGNWEVTPEEMASTQKYGKVGPS